jgi:hypothetical protein
LDWLTAEKKVVYLAGRKAVRSAAVMVETKAVQKATQKAD